MPSGAFWCPWEFWGAPGVLGPSECPEGFWGPLGALGCSTQMGGVLGVHMGALGIFRGAVSALGVPWDFGVLIGSCGVLGSLGALGAQHPNVGACSPCPQALGMFEILRVALGAGLRNRGCARVDFGQPFSLQVWGIPTGSWDPPDPRGSLMGWWGWVNPGGIQGFLRDLDSQGISWGSQVLLGVWGSPGDLEFLVDLLGSPGI